MAATPLCLEVTEIMDLMLILENWKLFAGGVFTTLWLVGLSLLFGGILAIPLALVRAYNVPVLGRMATIFSYSFRGTPLLVQIYILYYGLAQFEVVRDSFVWVLLKEASYCALISFSLNSAAYVCEIFRGAIMAVPKGEVEAAYATGMRTLTVIRRIVLPNALRMSIPAYSNEVIFMLHASVIASTITIIDILGAGRTLNGSYYVSYEGFITAALLYMIIVFFVGRIFSGLESRYLAFQLR